MSGLVNKVGNTPVGHVEGKWIWIEGEDKPYNLFLLARRTFDLAAAPDAAELHITASDRYLIYVNGTYLGRGPARSDPRLKTFDTYDVAGLLQPGRNVIAVRAYHYGLLDTGPGIPGHTRPDTPYGWGTVSGNGYTIGERAALWAQLEIPHDDGEPLVIGTDDSWRMNPARGWRRDAPPVNSGLVGSNEVYDANVDSPDWVEAEFDDSCWERAWLIPPSTYEWNRLEARDIPMIVEREAFPARIAKVGEIIDLGGYGHTRVWETLTTDTHYPLECAVAADVESVLSAEPDLARFQGRFGSGKGIRAPYLIVDFGRQVFGFPRVRLEADAGAILDLTYGQQLLNDRVPAALSYADRYVTKSGEQVWEAAEYKQFRYLHLTIRSTYAPVHIQSISLNEYVYPAEQRGRFECSDPVLTAVWQACVETTYLHMEDTIVCDAYRERLPWATGDGSHGLHGAFMAYGALPLTDRFLRQFITSARGDGMIQTVFPRDNPTWHGHRQFMLQWSTRIREHFMFTGRRALLDQAYTSVRDQVDWYEPHRDDLGLLRNLPEKNWMDWVPVDLRGANFSTNALYVHALEDAAWLADQVGVRDDARRWRSIAAEVRQAMRDVFWNAELGLYEDSHYKGAMTGVFGELAQGFALLYDIATEDQIESLGRHLSGRGRELVKASPLFFGYVMEGMLRAGLDREAIEMMSDRFRPMMEATDPPSIWEGWDQFTGGSAILTDEDFELRHTAHKVRPAGVRSMVHSGGVYSGWTLSTRVLGVMPTSPGFATCRIHPRLGGLAWARGVYPAPSGDIEVDVSRRDGAIEASIGVPGGVVADLVLEHDRAATPTLVHNGVGIDLSAAPDLRVEPGRISVRLESGRHDLTVTTQ